MNKTLSRLGLMHAFVLGLSHSVAACHMSAYGHAASAEHNLSGDQRACRSMAQAWPKLNREVQELLGEKSLEGLRRGRHRFDKHLSRQPVEACPVWQEPLARLKAISLELEESFVTQHAADSSEKLSASIEPQLGGTSEQALDKHFNRLHQEATEKGLLATNASWHQYLLERQPSSPRPAQKLRQRYLSNMGTDASLVQDDGQLGAPLDPNHYVALVKTQVVDKLLDRLISLQGQGPLCPQEASRYVDAALKMARGEDVGQVIFVNTAGGQIPDFGDAVAQSGIAMAQAPKYVQYDGWRDGRLVTPQMAAQFASHVADLLGDKTSHSMLVVNCNAGQDRSGVINVLVQLIMQSKILVAQHLPPAQIAEMGYRALDEAVINIKAARPFAISSSARYLFIHRAFAAYLDQLFLHPQEGPKTPQQP